jgi:hypothetical protein
MLLVLSPASLANTDYHSQGLDVRAEDDGILLAARTLLPLM